jgi:putative endonuclease
MAISKKPFYVYILRCADDTLYTGVATDIDRRIQEHNGQGSLGGNKGAIYTSSRRPVELVYFMEFPDRSSACKEEARLKKLPRSEKVSLISKLN